MKKVLLTALLISTLLATGCCDDVCFVEPTRTPYEQSKSAINRRFCYNMEKDSVKLIVKAHE